MQILENNFRFVQLFVTVLVALIMSGCGPSPSIKHYRNSEMGVSLEQPQNWDLSYFERSGSIVLETETGFWEKESTRIEIWGSACSSSASMNQEEILVSDIDRIRILYNLDSTNILQEPTTDKYGDYEVSKVSIDVPTTSLSDSVRNQIGVQDPNINQVIDIFNIKDNKDNSIMVYVYKGNNEQLNAEAEAIVDSIELICKE